MIAFTFAPRSTRAFTLAALPLNAAIINAGNCVSGDSRRNIKSMREGCQEVAESILSLAEELQQGTIESVLRKSDLELGLEFLQGKRKR